VVVVVVVVVVVEIGERGDGKGVEVEVAKAPAELVGLVTLDLEALQEAVEGWVREPGVMSDLEEGVTKGDLKRVLVMQVY